MKKIIIILFVLFLIIPFGLKSQTMRHVKGNQSIDVTAHLTAFSPAYSVGFSNYFKEKLIGKLKLNYESGRIGISDYTAVLLMPSVTYTPFNFKSIAFFNLEGGIVLGMEKGSNESFIENINTFIYGINLGSEVEIFIGSKIALLVNFNEIITFSSKFGNARYQIGSGVRIFIK